jgi:hypothetical protein
MQLTLKFDAGISENYQTCREYVAARVHLQGRPQKSIAADMDLSPSLLTRKLAQSPNDNSRFTLDDLEIYMAATNDTKPVLYLVEKYLSTCDKAELEKQIQELQARLEQKGKK